MTKLQNEFSDLMLARDIAYRCAKGVSGDWGAVKDADLELDHFMQNNREAIFALVVGVQNV